MSKRWRDILPILTTIRLRLTLWYVAILAAILLVFGGLVYTAQSRGIRADAADQLRSTGQQLAATYDSADGQLHPAAISKILRVTKSGSPVPTNPSRVASTPTDDEARFLGKDIIALLVDRNGQIVQHLGPSLDEKVLLKHTLGGLQAQGSFFTFTQGATGPTGPPPGQYLFYAMPITINNGIVGTLLIGHPSDAQQQLRQLLLALLLAAPATLLVAALGGYWLAARAMRPVALISRTAAEIGATDLSRRLDLPHQDELGELAATLNQMFARLEGAFARQRQFTADASHELRTPLTVVALEVEHALAAPRPTEAYVRALTTIRAENATMARLVNDLLMLARADLGQAVLARESLDLSDLALGVVERLSPLAQQRRVALITGALPELLINGDRLYLTQLLTNLVENALKFTSGQGTQVCVSTGSDADRYVWARIADNGPGIAPEHLPHLFDRFYQVDSARSQRLAECADPDMPSGSGLGLAIVQWIAQSHGGEVRVRSAPGQGATFEVRLPLAGCREESLN